MGGRRDGEGDKENDAKQRRAEMPSQTEANGSEQAREKCVRLEYHF